MNTISDGAQLNELAGICANNEKELSQISITMNKNLNNLTGEINAQVEIVDDNVLVIYYYIYIDGINKKSYIIIYIY